MLIWKIDSNSLNNDKTFHLNPVSGRLEGGQTTVIKVKLNKKRQVLIQPQLENFNKKYLFI
jgi:hypothetical protein